MTLFATTLASVLVSVGFHYEFLLMTSVLVQRLPGPRRVRVAIAIGMAVAAHLVEVAVFAGAWWLCVGAGVATLSIANPGWGDLFYFSGAVYTSLGFGDIVPIGPGRSLAIVEGVTGLVLIAWTASFTYFEMRENWRLEGQLRD